MLRRQRFNEDPVLAERRVTAVGADDQIRYALPRPRQPAPPGLDREPPPHVEVEGRVLAGLLGEHGEDRRLVINQGMKHSDSVASRPLLRPADGLNCRFFRRLTPICYKPNSQ